jgi:uncharacterized protein (TIGR00251 family)
MARITVKIHPRAKRARLIGKLGDVYKIDLAAPPVDGKANAACIVFLARLAEVSASQVRVVLGLTSRTKVIEIEGVEQKALESKLEA